MESTVKKLDYYFNEAKSNSIQFVGYCYDCGKKVTVNGDITEDKQITILGGAVYILKPGIFLKCDDCYKKDSVLHDYQSCEVYSRTVGYLRPVDNWNPGKQEEFKQRKMLNMENIKRKI